MARFDQPHMGHLFTDPPAELGIPLRDPAVPSLPWQIQAVIDAHKSKTAQSKVNKNKTARGKNKQNKIVPTEDNQEETARPMDMQAQAEQCGAAHSGGRETPQVNATTLYSSLNNEEGDQYFVPAESHYSLLRNEHFRNAMERLSHRRTFQEFMRTAKWADPWCMNHDHEDSIIAIAPCRHVKHFTCFQKAMADGKEKLLNCNACTRQVTYVLLVDLMDMVAMDEGSCVQYLIEPYDFSQGEPIGEPWIIKEQQRPRPVNVDQVALVNPQNFRDTESFLPVATIGRKEGTTDMSPPLPGAGLHRALESGHLPLEADGSNIPESHFDDATAARTFLPMSSPFQLYEQEQAKFVTYLKLTHIKVNSS